MSGSGELNPRARARCRRSPSGRLTALAATCLAGTAVLLVGPVAVSGGRVQDPKHLRAVGASSGQPTVSGRSTVTFSATVYPNGRATTAYFEFGLATRYREPRPPGIIYDERTQSVHLRAGFGAHSVSGAASGLVPNAVYHLRLLASSSAGTVRSRDRTFRTAKDPAPPPPVVGKTVNLTPVSGLVLIQPPRIKSAHTAGLTEGFGFEPLTEPRQVPIGSQIDARAGTLRLTVAGARRLHPQRAMLAGALFALSQIRTGLTTGLTTLNLLEDDFPGAPTTRSCPPTATSAAGASSDMVLQTLRVRNQGGVFQTAGRYSVATGGQGAAWNTADRCDGTLTTVNRGPVDVLDYGRLRTISVAASQRYLAKAP